MTVTATINDVNTEVTNAIPNGCNKRPSIPLKKNNGINDTIIIKVAIMIELRISTEASRTTVSVDSRSAFDFLMFSRRRLYTFSTSIIASSTSAPIAIAIPPKLIVFIV